jgi:hypothetical protein
MSKTRAGYCAKSSRGRFASRLSEENYRFEGEAAIGRARAVADVAK